MPRFLKTKHPATAAVLCVLALALLLAGCGYHLTGQADSDRPPMRLALANWQNQTGELAIEAEMRQELTRWCSKASFIHLTDAAKAGYILQGEFVSLSNPGHTYNETDKVVELQAELAVSYTLTDQKGKVVFTEPATVMTEDYPLGSDAIRTRDNRRHALSVIFRDLAEEIYMRLLIVYDQQGK